jgi:putative DNA primase/helicase
VTLSWNTPHVIPNPDAPLEVARTLTAALQKRDQHICFWRGLHYRWVRTHWEQMEDGEFIEIVYAFTERALYQSKDKDGNAVTHDWKPNSKSVGMVVHAFNYRVGFRTQDVDVGLFFANGVIESARSRELLPHSPDRFNLSCLPFEYQPDAQCPEMLKFLDSSLPGELTSHDCLQEWFGYVLSGRTDLHKILYLVGASRAGKSVIAEVLEAMIGADAASGVELRDFTSQFGLMNMPGKLLGVISEPDWATQDAQRAVEPLKKISGHDKVQVDRKKIRPWEGRLGVRFMILSNAMPRLTDRAGALANRMIYIRFSVSFAGREDAGLSGRLQQELPGILNWAMDGLARLETQDRITVPLTHEDAVEVMREYSDPDGAFLLDACDEGEECRDPESEIYAAYDVWRRAKGRTRDSTDMLSLRSRLNDRAGIVAKRSEMVDKAPPGTKIRIFTGIRVNTDKVRRLEREIGQRVPDSRAFD